MESIRKIFKWFWKVPTFLWGVGLGAMAALGVWIEVRGRRGAAEIEREIRAVAATDRAHSAQLLEDGDTEGMRKKLLDPENWK